jgi:putative phosphoribosyl transferase
VFYKNEQPIILALPRGGVPLGVEVAKKLFARLDVLVSRKIGAPFDTEYGIGAIAEENALVLDWATILSLGISKELLKKTIEKEKKELKRRVRIYRGNKFFPLLKNKTVILVDDGLATGVTARAAIKSIRIHNPKQIIFASPVCACDTSRAFEKLVDRVICLTTPSDLVSIGQWYESFDQMKDEDVINLLERSRSNKDEHKKILVR